MLADSGVQQVMPRELNVASRCRCNREGQSDTWWARIRLAERRGSVWLEALLRVHQDGVIDISGAEDEAGTSSPTAADSLASGYYRCGDDCRRVDELQSETANTAAASARCHAGWRLHRCMGFDSCASCRLRESQPSDTSMCPPAPQGWQRRPSAQHAGPPGCSTAGAAVPYNSAGHRANAQAAHAAGATCQVLSRPIGGGPSAVSRACINQLAALLARQTPAGIAEGWRRCRSRSTAHLMHCSVWTTKM